MKAYWHTKTLFLQNWKYYKWAYKYNHCIECWNCNHKHKWKWLCTSCRDKARHNKPKRIITLKKANKTYLEKAKTDTNIKTRLRLNVKKYQTKNAEVLRIIRLARYKKNRWYPVMMMIINWKTIYLPFQTLEKPNLYQDNRNKVEYEKWQKNIKDFQLLKEFYWKTKEKY